MKKPVPPNPKKTKMRLGAPVAKAAMGGMMRANPFGAGGDLRDAGGISRNAMRVQRPNPFKIPARRKPAPAPTDTPAPAPEEPAMRRGGKVPMPKKMDAAAMKKGKKLPFFMKKGAK